MIKSFKPEVFSWYIPICSLLVAAILIFGILVWCFSYSDRHAWIENFISFITLIFAMVVGYYAFEEFRITRIDRYKKEADEYLNGLKFEEAKRVFESAYSLGARDKSMLLNFSELCSTLGDFGKARKIAKEANGRGDSYRDEVCYHYLIILSYLGEKRIDKAGNEIKSLFEISKGKPVMDMRWSLKQVEKEMIPSMDGKAKKIFGIMKDLLEGNISPADFEQRMRGISWLDLI